jgi:UDP-N-acetylglucosamine--N-acetylmuramyl-(pentapeptide) pyrophosphoryl-undecaprenol N-acetylglucosamine transferase
MIPKKILMMAAGTGGHILPALAVAKALQAQGVEIHWLGTTHGLEQTLVPPTGIPMQVIAMRGVRGKGIRGLLVAPFRVLHATYQAMRVIAQLKPDAVFGFGGFVTVPGGLAAWLLRIPLLLHEQNAVLGMSNRYLAYIAKRVFQAFPQTFSAKYHALTCGNPVRAEILAIEEPRLRFEKRYGAGEENKTTPLHILVIGGSQGAAVLNHVLPETLSALKSVQPVEIWHATGKGAAEKIKISYQQAHIPAEVTEFIQDMPAAYTWADVVICRAGALTIAELAAAGVASILVPYLYAVDDHQTRNAAWLVEAGAAMLIPQNAFHADSLQSVLGSLAADRTQCLRMALAARKVAMLSATEKIVEACLEAIQ